MTFGKARFTYRDPWGSEHELALVRTVYQMTGNLAVEALIVRGPTEGRGATSRKSSSPRSSWLPGHGSPTSPAYGSTGWFAPRGHGSRDGEDSGGKASRQGPGRH